MNKDKIISREQPGEQGEFLKERLWQKAPLAEMLRRARLSECLSFHMPGHLGGRAFAESFRREALSLDTTETALSDNLLAPRPGGGVRAAEQAAASYYGAGGALLLSQGATLGLQAMLLHYVGKGGRLLLSGPIHKAVLQAAALLDIVLVSVPSAEPEPERPPLPPEAGPSLLENFLKKEKEAGRTFSAFLCTSPDYYGQMADVPALGRVLKRYGIYFLLDAAHGAHFEACRRFLGDERFTWAADAAVLSLHKTLPAMTGAALLLTARGEDIAPLRRAADIWGSSSPSLLIAASGDYARAYAEFAGEAQLAALLPALEKFRREAGAYYRSGRPEGETAGPADPLRICLDVSDYCSGPEAEDYLIKKGIVPEMSDLCRVVFIVSLAAEPSALGQLSRVLKEMAEEMGPASDLSHRRAEQQLREAYGRAGRSGREIRLPVPGALVQGAAGGLAAGSRGRQLLPLREAARRALPLAADIVPYPPGVPLFLAGETLRAEDAELLEMLLQRGLAVNGLIWDSSEPETEIKVEVIL